MGGGASKRSKKKNIKKPGDADGPPDISSAALRRRRVLFGHESVQDFESLDIWKQYVEIPTEDDRVFNRFEHANGGLVEANRIRQHMQKICSADGYLRYNVLELLPIGIGPDQKVSRRLYQLAKVERPSKRQLHFRSRAGARSDLGENQSLDSTKATGPGVPESNWTRHNLIGCYEFLALFSVICFGDIDELLELLFCFFDFDEDDHVSVADFEETIQSFLVLSSKTGDALFRDTLVKMGLLAGAELDEYHKLDLGKQKSAIRRSAKLAVWKYGPADGEAPPDGEEGDDAEEDEEADELSPPPPPTETVVEQPKAKPAPKPKKKGRGFCKGKQPKSDDETDITDVEEQKDDDEESDAKGKKDKKDKKAAKESKSKKDSKKDKKAGKDSKSEKDSKKALIGEDDSDDSSDEGPTDLDQSDDDKAKKAGCCASKKKKAAAKKEADKKAKEAAAKKEADKKDAASTDTEDDDKAKKAGCCGSKKKKDSKAKEAPDSEKKDVAKKLIDEDSDDESDGQDKAVEKKKKTGCCGGKAKKDAEKDQGKADAAAKAKAEAKAKAKAKARKASGGGCLPCCRARPKADSKKTLPPLTFEQWKQWFCDFVEVPPEVFDQKPMPTATFGGPGSFAPPRLASTTLLPERQSAGAQQSQHYPTIDTRQQGFLSDRGGPSNLQQPLMEPVA